MGEVEAEAFWELVAEAEEFWERVEERRLAGRLDEIEEAMARITPEYVRAKLHEVLTRQYGQCPGCSGCGGPEEVRDAAAR